MRGSGKESIKECATASIVFFCHLQHMSVPHTIGLFFFFFFLTYRCVAGQPVECASQVGLAKEKLSPASGALTWESLR